MMFAQVVVAFLMAVFMIAFGGWLLLTELRFRRHALRRRGLIVDIRSFYDGSGTTRIPVCRYALTPEQRFEVTGAHTSLQIGEEVELLVFPDEPRVVRDASDYGGAFFGTVLLVTGMWLLFWSLG
jgi:hypothetical protein